ncbi:MAG: type IV toxin-antitoxin system AbiEi family antitoxin domain-containing protein [Actinomycetota bacterium]
MSTSRRSAEAASGVSSLADLAARQHGAIGIVQACERGVSRSAVARAVRSGRLHRAAPGVYTWAGSPDTWMQRVMVGVLYAGPGAVASHRCAAALWRFPQVPRGVIEVSTTRRRRADADVVVHQIGELHAAERSTIDGISVTSPTRTLVDLAGVAPVELVEDALDDALRRGLTKLAVCRWELRNVCGRGRAGTRVLRRLLDERPAGYRPCESVPESDLYRLLRRAGLPLPQKQRRIAVPGGRVARVDLFYPDHDLVIEVDGYRYHGGRRRWQEDLARQNGLILARLRVLRFTWYDLQHRSDELVEQVALALGRAKPDPSL